MTHTASGVFITLHNCLPLEFIFKIAVTFMVLFVPPVIIFRKKLSFDKKYLHETKVRSSDIPLLVHFHPSFLLLSILCVVIQEGMAA